MGFWCYPLPACLYAICSSVSFFLIRCKVMVCFYLYDHYSYLEKAGDIVLIKFESLMVMYNGMI